MDITIDDTSPDFVWGAGDVWKAQAPNQASINSNYFLSTYHAAQTKGANVSITFVGSACQIYGSKGPNHGNYSVTFDNAVKFSPGFSEQSQYRQLLFSHSFGDTFDTHTVVLRNEEDFWLDLDFMVLTINTTANTATSDIGFFATTVSAATAVPPDSASTDSADSSSGSSSSNLAIFRTITFVLAALLGVLILALLFWFFVYRKRTAGPANGSANGDQDFAFRQKAGASGTIDARTRQAEIDSNSGRQSSSLLGYGRTKFGKGAGIEDGSLMQTPTSTSAMGDHNPLPFSRNSALANSVVGGAARETLIALNNMGKRPGYRNLGSEGESHSDSRSSVAFPTPHETTPTISVRTLGSVGQTWLKNDPEARFKGKLGPGSLSRLSSVDSDTNLSSMSSPAQLLASRNAHNRVSSVQSQQRGVDEEYASVGIGLGIYSNNRADQDQRRADLRRSASVASSGIIDRLASSPPPAVPELPPMSTTSSMMSRGVPSHTFSPTQSESAYSQNDTAYGGSALGLATRVKPSYTNTNTNAGALRLQPPPIRGVQEERERERTKRERERLEKEREAIREREEQERAQQEVPRYSRPPPEYMPTPSADQIPPVPTQGADLQRQGTRTGDIPIGIEGGFGYEETESQESHSVAHAFVQTALHVPVPPQQRQQIIAQQSQALSSQTTVNSYSQHPTATIPPASKRPFTPERSYNPNQTMAVPGERMPVGRSSEDKVWTLDGPNAASAQRGQGVGMPIMDDRARLAAVSPTGVKKVTRVPPPQP